MREKKRYIYLDSVERHVLLQGLIHFKNKLVRQGRYTDCVDELIYKVTTAPVRKVKN